MDLAYAIVPADVAQHAANNHDQVHGSRTHPFLRSPLLAWMVMDTINSSLVPVEHRYGPLTRGFCWFGLVFFSGFSLLFIGRFFLGLGG